MKETLPDLFSESSTYHWIHAERSSQPAVAQWLHNMWYCIGEKDPLTPHQLAQRGWEYLGPVQRPHSIYCDV